MRAAGLAGWLVGWLVGWLAGWVAGVLTAWLSEEKDEVDVCRWDGLNG